MTEQRRTALKELQRMDIEIQQARQGVLDFDPLLEEVEEPALVLESELETNRKRLKELTLEARRLELSTVEKTERRRRLDDRLSSVRNLREEAAVSAELEMVHRALQHDEQEALSVIDQTRKVEDRLEEIEAAYGEAAALVEPKRADLIARRDQAKRDLASLEEERERFASAIEPQELRTYEAIRSGGRRIAVAELTHDGACGHCFGMVPLQLQNEVRHGASLIRCEACGVILAAPEPESAVAAEPAPTAPVADEPSGTVEAAADGEGSEGDDDGGSETASVGASDGGDGAGDSEEE